MGNQLNINQIFLFCFLGLQIVFPSTGHTTIKKNEKKKTVINMYIVKKIKIKFTYR